MYLTPRQRLDGGVDDVGAVLADFQDRSHAQTRTGMAVILNDNLGMLILDHLGELAQEGRLTDTGHILQADFLCTGLYFLICQTAVVFKRMNGRSGDTQCSLWCHTCFLGPFDRRRNVADVVQAIEDTGNIHALSMLDAIHHRTHVVRHRIHA